MINPVNGFLRQGIDEQIDFPQTKRICRRFLRRRINDVCFSTGIRDELPNAEEKALTEFSDEKRNLEKEQQQLARIREHKVSLIGQLRDMWKDGLKADEIALFMDYIRQVQARET